MQRILNQIEAKARRVIGAALSSVLGGLLLVAGLVFLGIALWIALSALWGPALAALAIGGVLIGLGLVVFAVSSASRRAPPVIEHGSDVTVAALVEAFMIGLKAGKSSRGPTDGDRD